MSPRTTSAVATSISLPSRRTEALAGARSRSARIAAEAPAEWVRAVSEHVAPDAAERAADFADELPVGLKWISDDD